MLVLPKSLTESSSLQTILPLKHPLYAIIDYADYSSLSRYHWSARKSHSCWYAIRKETVRRRKRTVFMHRQIVNADPAHVVHHKNGNTLDNRRENLEVTTGQAHAFLHAEARLLHSDPAAHAACANFLASRGITALCHPPTITS